MGGCFQIYPNCFLLMFTHVCGLPSIHKIQSGKYMKHGSCPSGSCWLIQETTLHTDYWSTGQSIPGACRVIQTTRTAVQGWARSDLGTGAGSQRTSHLSGKVGSWKVQTKGKEGYSGQRNSIEKAPQQESMSPISQRVRKHSQSAGTWSVRTRISEGKAGWQGGTVVEVVECWPGTGKSLSCWSGW